MFQKTAEISETTENKHYVWAKADWVGCAHLCSQTDWQSVFCNCVSADDCWTAFCKVIDFMLTMFVPYKMNQNDNVNKSRMKTKYPKNV